MLIRWATEKDLRAWQRLAAEVSPLFGHPADMGADEAFITYARSKIQKYEALTAADYMSGANLGFIGFSRAHNRISWFAVAERHRRKGAGGRLLKTALRQLDTNSSITVQTFTRDCAEGAPARALYEKHGFVEERAIAADGLRRCELKRPASAETRGMSFHYRSADFIKEAKEDHCSACNNDPMPDGMIVIEENERVWITGEYPGQGRLFGKLFVMPKKHAFHFEDMPKEDAAPFMEEVGRAGRALRRVTGAVKINYEMHANSGAHLHIHLFPRYLDDDFPSAPIDYRVNEPAPYESYDEYLWFIEQMRKELKSCL